MLARAKPPFNWSELTVYLCGRSLSIRKSPVTWHQQQLTNGRLCLGHAAWHVANDLYMANSATLRAVTTPLVANVFPLADGRPAVTRECDSWNRHSFQRSNGPATAERFGRGGRARVWQCRRLIVVVRRTLLTKFKSANLEQSHVGPTCSWCGSPHWRAA